MVIWQYHYIQYRGVVSQGARVHNSRTAMLLTNEYIAADEPVVITRNYLMDFLEQEKLLVTK